MATDIDTLLQSYTTWLGEQIKTRTIGEYQEITTPFLDRHNDCIQLYLRYGVVQAPGERLEQRKLRQEIGETLISWADEYFSSDEHINKRIPRKEMYDSFITYDPSQRKYIQPQPFKKKLVLYCKWKGYLFNPNKYDSKSGLPLYLDKDGKPIIDDKSGGVEYFTIGKPDSGTPTEALDPLGIPLDSDGKLDF